MTARIPLCRDCEHIRPDWPRASWFVPIVGWLVALVWILGRNHMEFAKCACPAFASGSAFVDGRDTDGFSYCSTARNFDHLCGKAGKQWMRR